MDDEPAYVHGDQSGDRNAQVIQIDNGKHVAAVAVCAVVCGISVVLAWWASSVAHDAATEYRILLNHTMELEAQQKVMAAQLQEIQHGLR